MGQRFSIDDSGLLPGSFHVSHVFEVRCLPSTSTLGSLKWGTFGLLMQPPQEFKSRDLGASLASGTMCPHSVLLELLPDRLRRHRWLEQQLSRAYESTTG